jgi:hypothetical protein
MPVAGVTKFERCFRAAAGRDVDKDELKRYSEFVNQTCCSNRQRRLRASSRSVRH